MKRLESSRPEGDGEVQFQSSQLYKFDQSEQVEKRQTLEHENCNMKEGEGEEEEKGSEVDEENTQRVSELPEEYYHGLEDLPWNLNTLEQSVYVNLPEWIQAALLCNLAGKYGIWTFHNNFLPCRLMSYLFLPYTLPATVTISFIYRLLCWTRKILRKSLSMLRGLGRAVLVLPSFYLLHFRRHLPNRFPLLLLPISEFLSMFCLSALCTSFTPSLSALCFLPLPALFLNPLHLCCLALHFVPWRLFASTLNQQLEFGHLRQFLQTQQCSVHLQLSTTNDSSVKSCEPATFDILFDLELEVDCHSQANKCLNEITFLN